MQHLEPARLAAFDHEPLSVDELAHLAACAACRNERVAMQRLIAESALVAAGDDGVETPRLVSWDALAQGLRDEGLITTGPQTPARAEKEVPVSGRPWFQRARQVAAAVALVAGGASMERFSHRDAGNTMPVAQAGAMVQPVGSGEREFASVEQATDVLSRAQRDYERASVWLAANDPSVRNSEVYRARLAALDQMMAASRAALREAPQDPVLNHYYLAAWSAREATLRALSGALPVDKVIERY